MPRRRGEEEYNDETGSGSDDEDRDPDPKKPKVTQRKQVTDMLQSFEWYNKEGITFIAIINNLILPRFARRNKSCLPHSNHQRGKKYL